MNKGDFFHDGLKIETVASNFSSASFVFCVEAPHRLLEFYKSWLLFHALP